MFGSSVLVTDKIPEWAAFLESLVTSYPCQTQNSPNLVIFGFKDYSNKFKLISEWIKRASGSFSETQKLLQQAFILSDLAEKKVYICDTESGS